MRAGTGAADGVATPRPAGDSVLPAALAGTAAGLAAALALLAGLPGLPVAALGGSLAALAAIILLQARRRRGSGAASRADHERLERLADRMWELSENEERFRGLVDALGDVVVHRDTEGRITHGNRVLRSLAGGDPAGRTLAALGFEIGPPQQGGWSGERLASRDVRFAGAEGERWFSWVELSTRDETTGAVEHRAIARDITERKAAEAALIAAREKAENASAAKSRFLATVSHEIRTPLNGIMGMARLLADTGLTAEQDSYVSAITTSGAALIELIEELLDFSRIEAGRVVLDPEPTSPRDLAESVAELLSARAFAKGIGLGVTVSADVPATITADPGRLRQVLINLVGNAVKFTAEGGATIAVDRRGGAVAFTVTDTGPGIPAADRDRIFDEFEQGDGTTTRSHGGVGLGLAISRRIVEAMGGTLVVDAAPGGGARFTFTVPAGDAVAGPDRGRALAGRRFLVALTPSCEGAAIAASIRAFGGEADIAANDDDALALVAGEPGYQAALIGATADGLLAALRARDPKLSGLALLTPAERGRLPALLAFGHDGYLVRPVRAATLLRMLGGAGMTSAAARTGPALRVLVAEDNPVNALLVRAALARAGHAVEMVGDGAAAVGAAEAKRFDIVLMDMHMPEMDGLDAIARIRAGEESRGAAPVPILVLTADSQETTRQKAIAHGANGVLTKPLDPMALLAVVEQQAA